MINTFLFDLGGTILFSKDKSKIGGLNKYYQELKEKNLNFDFLDYFELDEELLKYLEKIKDNYSLYIVTRGNIQNSPTIKPRLDKIFKSIFTMENTGMSKKDPLTYLQIATKLGLKSQQILFIDDEQDNINAASLAGMNTFRYIDSKTLIDKIRAI